MVGVLRQIGPALGTLACLGACLLVGCAVPVARLLVVGPGSGRTSALAWPIAAFAPALIGFSLMGLATRTLFAQHRARRAGATTVIAWAVVIMAAVLVRLVVPRAAAVTGISLAVSLGMLTGAVVGWLLVRATLRVGGDGPGAGVARPLVVGLPVALVVGGGCWLLSGPLAAAGLLGSVLGSLACGTGCLVGFAVLLWLLDRRSFRAVLALRGLRGAPTAPVRTGAETTERRDD